MKLKLGKSIDLAGDMFVSLSYAFYSHVNSYNAYQRFMARDVLANLNLSLRVNYAGIIASHLRELP